MQAKSGNLVQKATLVLLGTIVGAGVFGLPAMFSLVGFWPGTILFWIIAFVVLATHLLFTEVILYHKQHLRLSGYAHKVLGKAVGHFTSVTFPLSLLGSCFAYVILGGEFLSALAKLVHIPSDTLAWQLVFLVMGAVIVFFGMKLVSVIEVWGTWALIATMLLVTVLVAPHINSEVIGYMDWSKFFLPYGVFLFAVGGVSVIAETVELVHYRRHLAYKAVILGSLGAAALSWMFGSALALAGGLNIEGEAMALVSIVPAGWGFMIPVVGFLAIATSFITVAQALKACLHIDFDLDVRLSWTLTFFLPFALLLLTRRDFLATIGLIGTLFGGLNGIVIAIMAFVVLRKQGDRVQSWLHPLYQFGLSLPVIVIAVYLFGIIQKLVS